MHACSPVPPTFTVFTTAQTHWIFGTATRCALALAKRGNANRIVGETLDRTSALTIWTSVMLTLGPILIRGMPR